MKSKQIPESNREFLTIASTILLLIICQLVIFQNKEHFGKRRLLRDQMGIQTEEFKRNQGLPATAENLVQETVYVVRAAFADMWIDETNHFAVLQQVKVIDFDNYRFMRGVRLFQLPFPLEVTNYYLFSRIGTNMAFEPHPPPAKRE